MIVLLSLSLLFIINCNTHKKAWDVSVEEVNGVTIVNNPEEPYYGELDLDIEENLVIGRSDDDNYHFYQANNLAVDKEDNIYLADGGNRRIQKFDKNGHYILTIGREGQGPGEFTGISDILFDEQDNLFVLGGRRIQIFNTSGEYLRGITLENPISNLSLDSDGYFFGITSLQDDKGRKSQVVKLDPEGKSIKTCAEFTAAKPVQRKSGESIVSFRAIHAYTPGLLLSTLGKEIFCYTHNLNYEIFIINKNGDLLSKILKDEKNQVITQAEKDHIISQLEEHLSRSGRTWPKDVIEEACDFPSSRPFFRGMLADDRQRIFIWRVKSVLDESDEWTFDVFSRDGYFIYRIKINFLPDLIKNGSLYNIEEDEDTGDTLIKRYTIKNWDQIKETI